MRQFNQESEDLCLIVVMYSIHDMQKMSLLLGTSVSSSLKWSWESFEDEMRIGIKTLKNVNCHRDINYYCYF